MEKIVVVKGCSGDENLINCMRALFPRCTVEVHERRPVKRSNNTLACDNLSKPDIHDGRFEECLSV